MARRSLVQLPTSKCPPPRILSEARWVGVAKNLKLRKARRMPWFSYDGGDCRSAADPCAASISHHCLTAPSSSGCAEKPSVCYVEQRL
jgi:hypothetical protein